MRHELIRSARLVCCIVVSLGLALPLPVLVAGQERSTLAPRSTFVKDEEKSVTVVQINPEERFLEFLEGMRSSLAWLNQAQGTKAYGFVVRRKGGLVTIMRGGGGSPKALAAIPGYALQFMDAHGLEELHFPLQGPYLPRLEQAIAQTNQPSCAGHPRWAGAVFWA